MKRYRKKSLVIDAVKWEGKDIRQLTDILIKANLSTSTVWMQNEEQEKDLWSVVIKTLEGDMLAMPGDYIVLGIKNEIYPVKPDIFEASYDLVEE